MRYLPLCLLILGHFANAKMFSDVEVKVFANRVIISAYDFDAKNYLARQKDTASFFTADGWLAFSKALMSSNINKVVVKNNYTVSAVATAPPVIEKQDQQLFKVSMPTMVVFKNAQFQQVQYISASLDIIPVKGKLKVQAFITKKGPPLKCQMTSQGLVIK